jgi:flavin reductase (DIM6/NTAB) family NADH-FMN oxidoreductase RutF
MARKNIGAKPYIMPMPVMMLSSYDENEKPTAMLAVWGGISNETEIRITVASERHTLKGILARQAFVVSMALSRLQHSAIIWASLMAQRWTTSSSVQVFIPPSRNL